jgi:hypothetical protein
LGMRTSYKLDTIGGFTLALVQASR